MYNNEDEKPQNNVIYGRNAISEALAAEMDIEVLYISSGENKGSIIPLIAKAREKKILIKEVADRKLSELSGGSSHQGIVAQICEIEYKSVSDIIEIAKEKNEPAFIIIADEIKDPYNLGAIIRTAAAAGAHGLIIPKRRSASVSAGAIKSSAGVALNFPVAKVTSLSQTIAELKKENIWIFGADMEGTSIYETNLGGAVALIIGSEDKGISHALRTHCDFTISIPIYGKVESLNASVAAGIAMYEFAKTRAKKN